jgi:signal transduction histidine kinase
MVDPRHELRDDRIAAAGSPPFRWGIVVGSAFLVATVVAIIDSSQLFLALRLRDQPISALRAVAFALPEWYLWAAFAPLIFWVSHRFPVGRNSWPRNLPLHGAFAVAVALVHLLLTLALAWQMDPPLEEGITFGAYYVRVLLRWFHVLLLVYAAIAGCAHAIDLYRKYRRRELEASRLQARLAHARLDALRAQLQPHFLFNALNTVANLARKGDSVGAIRTLAELSDLLRLVLDGSREVEVPLRAEVDFARRYLSIERSRFADRLLVEFHVSPDVEDALVPNLLLQPIVENAVHHGIAKRPGSGRIIVEAARADDRLVIRIRDDGPGPGATNATEGRGLGLGNTRERLRELYGDAQRLELFTADEGGGVVEMEIPFRLPESVGTEVMHG